MFDWETTRNWIIEIDEWSRTIMRSYLHKNNQYRESRDEPGQGKGRDGLRERRNRVSIAIVIVYYELYVYVSRTEWVLEVCYITNFLIWLAQHWLRSSFNVDCQLNIILTNVYIYCWSVSASTLYFCPTKKLHVFNSLFNINILTKAHKHFHYWMLAQFNTLWQKLI